ncbi:MAG: trimethylamine methyltransferase family protein [Paracoccaceae bacterium]|nr:trimethylamine methyltransferase family protein [Paracoccaceae bacterium]
MTATSGSGSGSGSNSVDSNRKDGRFADLRHRRRRPRTSRRPVRQRSSAGTRPDPRARMAGGSRISAPYHPLTAIDVLKIHRSALDLLGRVGMASPTPRVAELAVARGCRIDDRGRLMFPPALLEDIIDSAAKRFIVHGRDPAFDFVAVNGSVNFCTGGAAVTMLDIGTRCYRPSTLTDLYDLSRLCDTLENIQWFTRPVVATDITDEFELDVNTVYASAAGTRKHIAGSLSRGDHVHRLLPLLDELAGGEGRFSKRPFFTVHATDVVSPMRFSREGLDVICAAIDIGMPVHVQTGPQAGATAPATLAGTLAQICAEGLASLAVVNILRPGHPAILGNWAFVTDLRTGAFTGGSGEAALLAAASGQMSAFYGVPGGMGAGMSDSKVPDGQSGFEKALTLCLAALSGSGMVFESAGMLASLLGCSFESMVIDDEMLSVIRRIARGIEVNDETLAVEQITEVIDGAGHFLGEPQTLEVMETEFIYPRLSDRLSPDAWILDGGRDLWDRAREEAIAVLETHYPKYVEADVDDRIRAACPIRLNPVWHRPAGRREYR